MKQEKLPKNVLFFTNGSIGDFLMVLFFMKIVREQNATACLCVITPRNKSIFLELADGYGVSICQSNFKSLSGVWNSVKMFKYFFSKNITITPSTPGKIPLRVKLFAKAMSIFDGGTLNGFDDQSNINKYLYDNLYKFNESILYPDSMIVLAKKLGLGRVDNYSIPILSFAKNDDVLKDYNLDRESYFVLHPCGSSIKRTLLQEEIEVFLDYIFIGNSERIIVFTGNKNDSQYIDNFISNSKYKEKIINLAGKLSMKSLVSVISSSQFYLGVDTGITHLASVLGKKGLVISHEGSVFYWLPYYNKNARILYKIKNCEHGINEGINHLRECYSEKQNYLCHVSLEVIKRSLGSEKL